MICGGIFLVLIVMAAIAFVVLATKGSALDKESKAYIDEVVPVICSDLRILTLSKYASQELLNSGLPAEQERIFDAFKKLGEFKEYKESSGDAKLFYTTQHGKTITAEYTAQVEFESGPAQVKVSLIKQGDQWKIRGFRINSPALIP